ncbi:hypothetical protein POSPLADRAFT_1057946 [Postia placenta MAD-698-R-SB12]|uniref:Uncharacterized protein n=1 Tax=Postia placenta MAD-698-R-SB12 TaxID=670580 RepID=A0A1X6MXM1_9APHY|nr:hypothetical protein POSPLADRAFT_1057946 [Postia placenta MAD-698-R-SB12]OSX61002.1 hypothetical protein POSPLADRAFT_1057946 [Postia placenta MAD-698-R-SB12]
MRQEEIHGDASARIQHDRREPCDAPAGIHDSPSEPYSAAAYRPAPAPRPGKPLRLATHSTFGSLRPPRPAASPPGSVFTDYPENARIPLPRLTRGARSAHCAERRQTTFHVRAGAPSGGVLAPVARTARLASAGSVPVVARIIACPLPVTRPSSPRPPPPRFTAQPTQTPVASPHAIHRPRVSSPDSHPRHPPTRTRDMLSLAAASPSDSHPRRRLTRQIVADDAGARCTGGRRRRHSRPRHPGHMHPRRCGPDEALAPDSQRG